MTFKFISFDPTPKEAKQLGLATVLLSITDKNDLQHNYYLTYKIVLGKNDIPCVFSPSCKTSSDTFDPAFLPDSNFEKKQVEQLCIQGFNDHFKKPTKSPQPLYESQTQINTYQQPTSSSSTNFHEEKIPF